MNMKTTNLLELGYYICKKIVRQKMRLGQLARKVKVKPVQIVSFLEKEHNIIVENNKPNYGDVIVFQYPLDKKISYIKRVIALPGDKIDYLDKVVYVNDKKYSNTSITSSIISLEDLGDNIIATEDNGTQTYNILKNKNLGNLSGGEFQRVLLARAISKKPELLVLDEPVQGVDYTGEIVLYELIKKISDTLNCGILLISHDLHTVMTATDYVVCLNGHVCCSGTPIDVAKNNEYKTLFGEQASQILSIYEHKHDHEHSHEGDIKKN